MSGVSGSYNFPYVSYPGSVFATCYQAAAWLNNVLASGSTPARSVVAPALAVFNTLQNGADAVAAWQAANAMALEVQNMAAIQALPLTLSSGTLAYFNARSSAISAAASGLLKIAPTANPFTASPLLAAGQPAIAYPGFLEWCMAFNAEAPPAGLAASNLVTYASGEATAWNTIAMAIQVVQGTALTPAYDTAARQYRISSSVSGMLAAVTGATGPFTQTAVTGIWNGTVAMPSLLLDAATLVSAPSQLQNQQGAAIRFTLRQLSIEIAQLLLSLRSVQTNQVLTAELRRSETLMDLAARAGGGFENWSTIAALNNIQPPWPGPTNQSVAASGTPLLMPGSSLPASGVPYPTYEANVLGIDYDFGPINGTQPAWIGDFPLIVGYSNFARALGRRIQTPLGALIYHTGYGSRIPGEVGAIQSSDEAARLSAFGNAALAADPRTAYVVSSSASVQSGFLGTFSGTVMPVGPGATATSVNETINPLP
jgi:hypothetical protein